jgi:hypothetical protein
LVYLIMYRTARDPKNQSHQAVEANSRILSFVIKRRTMYRVVKWETYVTKTVE